MLGKQNQAHDRNHTIVCPPRASAWRPRLASTRPSCPPPANPASRRIDNTDASRTHFHRPSSRPPIARERSSPSRKRRPPASSRGDCAPSTSIWAASPQRSSACSAPPADLRNPSGRLVERETWTKQFLRHLNVSLYILDLCRFFNSPHSFPTRLWIRRETSSYE